MDKKIAGLLGAAAALASFSSAQAAPTDPSEVLKAESYADLLKPIPNALAALEAVDRQAGDPAEGVKVAQFYIGVGRDHHHHHHHNSYYRRDRDERVIVVPRDRRYYRDRHHHHHHHNSYYRRYRDDD